MKYSKKALNSLFLFFTLLPIIVLCIFVLKYGVNIPFADEWDFSHDVKAYFDGDSNLSMIWQQHNEHRIMIPKLFMLLIAGFTNWNLMAIMFFTIFTCIIILLLLLKIFRDSEIFEGSHFKWLVLFSSLFIFSLQQHEAWTWGFQCQMPIAHIFVLLGVLLLTREKMKPFTFVGAWGLGFLAMSSFASGHVFWVLGGYLLFIRKNPIRIRLLLVAFWILLGVAAEAAYFNDYTSAKVQSELQPSGNALITIIKFTFSFLGSLITNQTDKAFIYGGLGVFFYAALYGFSLYLYPKKSLQVHRIGGIGLFSIGAALLTALGRGNVYALSVSSRYIPMALFLWVSLFAFGLIFLSWVYEKLKNTNPRQKNILQITGSATLVFLLFSFVSFFSFNIQSASAFKGHHFRRDLAAKALKSGEDFRMVSLVTPDLDKALVFVRTFKEYKFALFSDQTGGPLQDFENYIL